MNADKYVLTLILYQKFKHSRGCSFPLKPGVVKMVVAELASLSFVPATAKALLVPPNLSVIRRVIFSI